MTETWTLAPAARAAGVPLAFAKRALDRALLEPDVEGRGAGCYRELARSTIYKLAITWMLSRLGVPPGLAAEHAAAFTDRGQPDRVVGQLFETGRTLLVVVPGHAAGVANVPAYSALADVLDGSETAIIVNVNQLVERVDLALCTSHRTPARRHGQPHYDLKGI